MTQKQLIKDIGQERWDALSPENRLLMLNTAGTIDVGEIDLERVSEFLKSDEYYD